MDEAVKRSFGRRIAAAMALDVSLYEEVEADGQALGQALVVVVAASFAQAFGVNGLAEGFGSVVNDFIVDLAGWFLWAGITYLIGTRVFAVAETEATWGQLLRTTGFSASPGLLAVVIPLLSGVLLLNLFAYLIIVGWTLVAFVLAVRQALDYRSTWRAVFVCVVSWPLFVIVTVFI